MEKARNDKQYAALAAAILGFALLCRIGIMIQSITQLSFEGKLTLQQLWLFLQVVQAVYLAALVITLLCRTRIGVMVAAVHLLLLPVYNLLRFPSFYELLYLLAYAMMILLLILSLAKVQVDSFLRFLPALLLLVGGVLEWSSYFNGSTLKYLYGESAWALFWMLMLIALLAEAVGFLFVGLWIETATPERAPARGSIADKYAGTNRNVAPADTDGGSDNNVQAAAGRFCGRCGSKNNPGMDFCQFCGAPLRPRP